MLIGKKILIGITGSIAAYKIPFLIRLLIKDGAEVKIVMTRSACDFITPLTLSALSQNPVAIEPFSETDGRWHSHIELGSWADIFLIAPLSANTMAKMATGITDNLLLATYLAARCKVLFAPAMDVDMFNHPTTKANILKLMSFGNKLIEPREGELASGLTGFGRMEEPEAILEIINRILSPKLTLSGKSVLITSGPTVEAIDPVRYLSNHSSGQMGNALAMEAAERGANVTLISGPVKELPVHPNISVISIVSAAEMYVQCANYFPQSEITIMAAAVADYSILNPETSKLKKSDTDLTLNLVKTNDILLELGKQKKPGQLLAGFALETDNELENALKKLHTKNLDFIVLNSLKDEGAGFATSTNKVTIIDSKNTVVKYDKKTKKEVSSDIFDFVSSILSQSI